MPAHIGQVKEKIRLRWFIVGKIKFFLHCEYCIRTIGKYSKKSTPIIHTPKEQHVTILVNLCLLFSLLMVIGLWMFAICIQIFTLWLNISRQLSRPLLIIWTFYFKMQNIVNNLLKGTRWFSLFKKWHWTRLCIKLPPSLGLIFIG